MSAVPMLTLAAHRYRPEERLAEFGDWALHIMEDPARERAQFALVPPVDLSFNPRRAYASVEVQTVTLERIRWRREHRRTQRERRAEARAGKRGRRGATRVPIAERWEGPLFAPHDAPEEAQRWAIETSGGLPLVGVVWQWTWRRRGRPAPWEPWSR